MEKGEGRDVHISSRQHRLARAVKATFLLWRPNSCHSSHAVSVQQPQQQALLLVVLRTSTAFTNMC